MQLLPLAGLVPEGAGRGSFWGCPLERSRKEMLLLPTHLRPPSNALTGRTNKPTKEKEFRVPTPAWESWSELRPSSFKTRPILPSGCSAPPAITPLKDQQHCEPSPSLPPTRRNSPAHQGRPCSPPTGQTWGHYCSHRGAVVPQFPGPPAH